MSSKSAAIRRTFMKNSQVNQAATKIQRFYRKKKSKPSRLYSGKKTYDQTRKITNAVMANISESKFRGIRLDCLDTVPKPGGTVRPMSYILLNTGSNLTPQFPDFQSPMNLFNFPQGTTGTSRVGDYMYLKHTYLKLEVQALPYEVAGETLDPHLNAPVRCRLMIVKANRKNNKFGQSPSPGNSLFIDVENDEFGFNENGQSINMLMKQPINKRKWLVYKDTSFTLTPAAVGDTSPTLTNAYAPSGKRAYRCNVKLPVYKKTHFDSINDTPNDIDTQWFVILQCVREAHCFQSGPSALRPTNIRMEVLGTTSALDN